MNENNLTDFFIVGIAKAGTTALYSLLSRHQDIYLPKIKEINYFTHDLLTDLNTYYGTSICEIDTLKKYTALYVDAKPTQLKGDVSPSYIEFPDVSGRIKNYNPDAKIIIVLRSPISRAISHYLMDKRLGYCNEDFVKIFSDTQNIFFKQYFTNGLYSEKIKSFIDTFPDNQIKVIIFEKLISNPEQTLNDLYKFLGLAPTINSFLTNENPNMEPNHALLKRIYQSKILRRSLKKFFGPIIVEKIKSIFFSRAEYKLSNEMRVKLESFYADDRAKLSSLLIQDLSLWK